MPESEIKEVEILRVFAKVDPETGEMLFAWTFGSPLTDHTMLGLLDKIHFNVLLKSQGNVKVEAGT